MSEKVLLTKELLAELRENRPGPIFEMIYNRMEQHLAMGNTIEIEDPFGECIVELHPAKGSC